MKTLKELEREMDDAWGAVESAERDAWAAKVATWDVADADWDAARSAALAVQDIYAAAYAAWFSITIIYNKKQKENFNENF